VIHLPARALVLILLLAPLGCAQLPTSPTQELPPVGEQRVAKPAPPAVVAPRAVEQPEPPAVAEQWAAAFTKGDLDGLMSLYGEDALLWGTSASKMRKGASAIRQYYAQLLEAFPGLRISLAETSPRVYGDAGVNSGSYTMHRVVKDGRVSVTSARFTMVYVRRGGKWLIVDHHSSLGAR
ncbi:MAG: SgcJ/EcaC family oxidoreductase, partial [Burkholderiales bacterium]